MKLYSAIFLTILATSCSTKDSKDTSSATKNSTNALGAYSCQIDVSDFASPEVKETSKEVTLQAFSESQPNMMSENISLGQGKSFTLQISPIESSAHLQATVLEISEAGQDVSAGILASAMVPSESFTMVARHDIPGGSSKMSQIICLRK